MNAGRNIATTETAPPELSIVVPTCNRPELLALCLDGLRASIQAYGHDVEVIVTDDSRGDDTERLVRERYPAVKWVAGPRRGPAQNRNCGAAAAAGNWLLFTDDDCLPATAWVGSFAAAIAAGGARVLEGKTVTDRGFERLDDDAPVNLSGGYLWSCNIAVERRLFEALGGFCAEFPYAGMEDTDFKLRLDKARQPFTFVPGAVVCHPIRRNKGHAYQLKVVDSYLLLVKRHPELLGATPWRNAALNVLRRVRILVPLAIKMRFRGFRFAVGSLAIQTYSDVRAILALRAAARR
jgi:GT2 family glycosyltransferase